MSVCVLCQAANLTEQAVEAQVTAEIKVVSQDQEVVQEEPAIVATEAVRVVEEKAQVFTPFPKR